MGQEWERVVAGGGFFGIVVVCIYYSMPTLICYIPLCEAQKYHPFTGSAAPSQEVPDLMACARGDKHPNYLLAFTEKGRRRCLYVPQAMVPVLKRALKNGRRVEQLLYEMGPALLRQYRAGHPAKTGPALQVKQKKEAKS